MSQNFFIMPCSHRYSRHQQRLDLLYFPLSFDYSYFLNNIDAMSAPQVGAQFSEIRNNGTSGNVSPFGEMNNQTSSMPGQGYPGEYYSHHSNETSPTTPTMSGGQANFQNSTLPTSTCDCNQISNVNEFAPTNSAPTDVPAGGDPMDSVSSASSAASSS